VAQLDTRPLLIVISGPSGAGKGTALDHISRLGAAKRVPTYTTRAMRSGEAAGVNYEYVSEERFFELYAQGVIFEYTRTYQDSYYGSPSALLQHTDPEPLAAELDPHGFVRVRAASTRRVVGLFIAATSESTLRTRLEERGQETGIDQRLKVRTDQMVWSWIYDYVLFNEDRDEFLADLEAVVKSELLRTEGARRILALGKDLQPTLTPGD
jgi:guanylate kinase